MKLAIFIAMTVLMCLVMDDTKAFDDFPMDDNDLYNCFYTIICKLRKPQEFRRILKAAGPKLMEEAIPWFKEISKMPDAEDTQKWWSTYPDRKCAYSEEVKRDMFNQWLIKMGEWWADVCENRSEEECANLNNASKVLVEIMTEYTVSGDCSSKAAASAAQKGVEEVNPMEGSKSMNPMAGPMMG